MHYLLINKSLLLNKYIFYLPLISWLKLHCFIINKFIVKYFILHDCAMINYYIKLFFIITIIITNIEISYF